MANHRQEPHRSSRLKPLDGLRALAVGVVFLHHVFVGRWPGGFLGVDLFFAISGYIITATLLREWQRTGRIWLLGFYARRFLRLMPALLASVIVMAPIGRAIGYHNVVNSGLAAVTYVMDIYAVFTGARNGGFFAHTWSLAVEEQFYLVWPTLLLFTLRRRIRGPWVAVVIGIAAALVTEAVQVRAPDQIGRLLWTPFPYLPTIAAGVLLAFALSTETGRQPLRFFARPLLPAAVMVGLVIASFEVQELARWLYLGGYVIIAILFTALVGHVVLAPESGPSRLLSAKPVVWLGTRSYGFYIWHYPIVLLMRHDLHETWLRAAVVLLISLVVTELSWRLVEQPFLRLKNRRFEPPNVVGNSDPTSVRKTSTP